MKKSRMLLLFGGLFLMLVGYVAWCGRTFYLRAPAPDLSVLPAEARALAQSEIESMDMRRPEKFTVGRLTKLLMQPYESDPTPILTMLGSGGEEWYVVRDIDGDGFSLLKFPSGWQSFRDGVIVD